MKCKVLIAVLMSIALAGCNVSLDVPGTTVDSPGLVKLSSAQISVVQAGVKQIIPNPSSARFSLPKAMVHSGKKEVQVCGHVQYRQNNGKEKENQYYMELKAGTEQPELKRGQVGSDPSRLSKVKFMCRHHK